jgi:dTDP-4-dehydrorhamnose reductase
MRIAIFGSTGMVGHLLTNYLESLNKYEINNISRTRLNPKTIIFNAENKEKLSEFIERKKFDLVINCIGVLIKESEQNPDRAIYLNSFFPQHLAKLGRRFSYKLIHLSTDCVFSGNRGDYKEADIKDGTGVYAQTKSIGEVINDFDLTIRTSVIGPEIKKNGSGLFHWFMNQQSKVSGYSRVYWTGVTSLELAKAIETAITSDLRGVCHLVPEKKISKYELLCLINEVWNRRIIVEKAETPSSDKSLINTRNDFKYKVKDYPIMLKELKEWMERQKNTDYSTYF